MNVKDLIAALRKCKPESEVVCHVSWDDRVVKINSVERKGTDDSVILSDSIPKVTGQDKG